MGAMEPGWAALVVGLGLVVVLLGVPGLLVATALDPSRPFLERLAVAPAVSIAIGFGVASLTSVLGLRGAPVVVAGSLAVASLASGAVVLRRPRSRVPLRARVRRSHLVLALSLVLLLGVWVVAVASSRAGGALASPGIDMNTHGIMTSRILQLGTLRAEDVTPLDLGASSGASSTFFYVLGIHAVVAVVAAATCVPSALVATFVAATVWLVLGVFVLARRCADPRTAATAALVAAVGVPLLPFSVVFWGGLPLVLGIALVPPIALVLLDIQGWRRGLLGVLAVAGLVAAHPPEVVAVGAVVAVALLAEPQPVRERLRRGGAAVAASVLALVVLAPTTVGLLAGGADRLADPPLDGELVPGLVHALFTPLLGSSVPAGAPSVLVVLAAAAALALASAGAVHLRRVPLGLAVSASVGLFTVLGVLAYSGLATALVRPWYANGERLVTQSAALLPVLLAAGFWLCADVATRRSGRGTVVALVALGAALLVPLAGRSTSLAVQGIDRFSVLGSDDRAAFAWLAAHVAPGERVLNDVNDGSTWSNDATRGVVAPVFGAMPARGFATLPEFADRLYLANHVADIGTDARAASAADQWRVRYVLSGGRTLADVATRPDRAALAASTSLRVVFRSGEAVVYEIVGP